MAHEYKMVPSEDQVVDAATVRCNKCGEKVKAVSEQEGDGVVFYSTNKLACLAVAVRWGYWSKKDGERHAWEMCEDCYDALVATFAIPPKITSYM